MSEPSSSTLEFAAVILAAGRSSRMGQPKLQLPWGQTSVLGHLISQWTRLGPRQLAIVCAAGDDIVAAELDRLGFPCVNRICNPAPERGMFSSVQCAASWAGWLPRLTRWALVLGDQPQLRLTTLAALLEFARAHPGQVCQPALVGRPRHPVVMPKPIFSRIAASRCSTLKEFLVQFPAALCESHDPGLDCDLDTPEDYRRALERFKP